MQKEKIPKIAILMATYNGDRWLSAQMESILNQQGVEVKVIVSDDMSTDGTKNILQSYAKKDSRITILKDKGKFGFAANNFYRLITDVDVSNYDFIAFSDQDDIWVKDKLSALANIAKETNSDGVSSNVVAFWPDGKRALIDKSKAPRRLDFIFECSGPGCTFLMSPWLIKQAKSMLLDSKNKVNLVKAHDWLMYVICRASGRLWTISTIPTVEYRQHNHNELGVNKGIKARLNRLQRLNSGWYKAEVVKVCELSLQLTQDAYLKQACKIILGKGFLHRFKLLKYANQCKRSVVDRVIFGLAIAFNIYR